MAPTEPPSRGNSLGLFAGVAAVGLAIGGAVYLSGTGTTSHRTDGPRVPPTASPQGTQGAPGSLPGWASRPVSLEADAIMVVGHGNGATSAEAESRAYDDAIGRVLSRIQTDLDGSYLAAFLSDRKADVLVSGPKVSSVFEKQVGALATPERTERFATDPSGSDVYVRYKLSSSALSAATKWYREEVSIEGLTVGPAFPTLAHALGDADLVLIAIAKDRLPATASSLRAGDTLVAVAGRPVATLRGVESVLDRKNDLRGAPVVVSFSSGGLRTDVRLPGRGR